MITKTNTFGELFKKFRLRSGFVSLRDFADALAEKGFIFEDSLFSHWQKNTRTPKDRKLLLAVIKIFITRKGISSIKDINNLLESVNQSYLTEQEAEEVTAHSNFPTKLTSAKKVLTFFTTTARSKRIIRTGWKREGVKDPESVAEHSFQLSVMAMVLADQLEVDKEKLIKMAILHDLGELSTGDIVWSRGKIMDIEKRTNKETTELLGIKKMFAAINKTNEYKNIFEEMMERKSPEAKIFWQLDKLEMAIQAMQYEKDNNKKLDEFFINTNLQLYHPFLQKIFAEVLKQRAIIKKHE